MSDQFGNLPGGLPELYGWQRVLQYSLPFIFLVVLIIPAWTYFVVNDAAASLFGPNVEPAMRFFTLFRLLGLYAFTFLWGQLMIGPFMKPLGKIYGKNWFYFHRMQGLFALLLACLHPLILYVGYITLTGRYGWLDAINAYTPKFTIALLGEIALLLMLLTISSALLMRKPWMKSKWHWIHLLNYVIFVLVWVHSYVLGTEAKVAPMSWLYIFFGLTFIMALVYRRGYRTDLKS